MYLVMTLGAKRDGQTVVIRKPAVIAMYAVMCLQWARCAANKTIFIFVNDTQPHSPFIAASFSGGNVSMFCNLHSCTSRSISRDICAVSYVDEP